MAKQAPLLVGLLLALALVASACGSAPESVIVGAADDSTTDEAPIADERPDDVDATVSSSGFHDGPSSVDDLLGTSWVIDTLNGEPYGDEAGLTFFNSSRQLAVAFDDVCSAGGGDLRLEGRIDGDIYVVEPWVPIATDCSDHPAGLFAGNGVELSITITNGVLSISSPTGDLTATHFQSVSVHDDLLELPTVSSPNLKTPERLDPADLIDAADSAIPDCGTPDYDAIEPTEDLIDSDVFAKMLRLYVVSDELPFVDHVSIHEGSESLVSISMSKWYGPTIDWIAEAVDSTPVCLVVNEDAYGDAVTDAAGDAMDAPTTTLIAPPASTIAPTTTLGG